MAEFKVISGQIIRSPKRGAVNYTPISNKVLQNTDLSFGARGLLIYILSLPITWKPVKAQIQKKNNYGKDAFNTIWRELVNKNYVHSSRVKDKDSGKFLGWSHTVYEEPTIGKTDSREILHSDNHTIIKEEDNKRNSIEKIDIKKEGAYSSTSKPTFTELFKQGNISSEDAINFINNNL